MKETVKIVWDGDRCRGRDACGWRCLKESAAVEPCRFCSTPPPRPAAVDPDAPTVILTVNGTEIRAVRGATLLDVLRGAGCTVPTLCHHPALPPLSACRLCIVEVTRGGDTAVKTACDYIVDDAVAVATDTPRLRRDRRVLVELLLSELPDASVLSEAAAACGVRVEACSAGTAATAGTPRCIGCGRCVAVSERITGCRALSMSGKSSNLHAAFPFEATESAACHKCGACAAICPVGARIVPEAPGAAPSCDLCVWICPDGAIAKKEGVVTIDSDRCKSCGLCLHYCPDKALHPTSSYDR